MKMIGTQSRRRFLGTAGTVAAPLAAPAFAKSRKRSSKVMVLGVDGMDPALTRKLIAAGRLPHCARLAKMGCFESVGTTFPPQSPVAWSSFVSGTNPGGHGIFDFIARDPESRAPFLSTAKTEGAAKAVAVGDYVFPLGGGETRLLRQGPTLWDIIAGAGMNSVAIRAPVNFPAPENGARTLTGITTPDVQGSYGIFSWFTTDVNTNPRDVPGGEIRRVAEEGGRIDIELAGPVDPLDREGRRSRVPLRVYRDAKNGTALLELPDQRLLLAEGEWSEWVTLEFPVKGSFSGIAAICRFCLKGVGPVFDLYVSPFNIDPKKPVADISSPRDFAAQLADEFGDFHTQGMPEDTSALSAGVFSDSDFLEQSRFVLEERMRMLDHELNRYEDGFFYFYFSSLDLNSHAFWRTLDRGHPLHTPELEKEFGDVLPSMYARIDEGIGKAMEHIDEDTLFMVISDHGFVPFRRQFNLNSWLLERGYTSLKNRFDRDGASFFENTDWTGTQAYGLGINSLYLNQKGREHDGIVEPGDDFESLRSEIIDGLHAARDPETGERIVRGAYRPEEIYSGPHTAEAPDIVVCYEKNYRASWDTILGAYPRETVLDNLDPWSGDHCMHPDFLAGVFFCNRAPTAESSPNLWDLAPSILDLLDIEVPGEMTGRRLWG